MPFRSGRCRYGLICLGALLISLLPTSPAQARRFFRARFEAETLELQKPGELEIDVQSGGTYGDGEDGSRLIIPDLELDLGITSWLEIDIDGAVSLTELEKRHGKTTAGDPIWLSGRFALKNWKDAESGATFGVGLQAGPRFPSINTPDGVGFGGLLLVGGGTRTLHLVASSGAMLDRGQHKAIAYGVDCEWELAEHWSLLGDLAAAHYFGPDPSQVLLDAGVAYRPDEQLRLSLLATAGPFLEGDRAGGLLGVSYSFQTWK